MHAPTLRRPFHDTSHDSSHPAAAPARCGRRRLLHGLGALLAWAACSPAAGGPATKGPAAPAPDAPAAPGEAAAVDARPVLVACVGEQTTHSAHRENDPEYPTRLAELLGAGYAVHNFGLPKGRVLVNGPAPESDTYAGSAVFEQSRAAAPDVVVFGPWGRHDTYEGNWPELRDEFPADLERLARAYTELPNGPRVFVVTPLPFDGGTAHPITELLEPTQQLAHKLSLPVIDLWSAFLGHPELYKDGTHLTPEGQQRHAQVVSAAITAAREP